MALKRPAPGAEDGQALVLMLGAALVTLLGAVAMGALGSALLGKGRVQRAADLAAIAAARSMRDDFARLHLPPAANGVPNPAHLPPARFYARARDAALRTAARGGLALRPGDITFPGAAGPAPIRVRVRARGRLPVRLPGGRARDVPAAAAAEAEVAGWAAAEGAVGSEGGYPGPFAHRQGKPMRPDVARAFDRMEVAARRDGVALVITSAFRSDAEQARLYAEHPNPRWVAPPGRSLHRNATELDLGPPSAYDWLARNAGRFHFVRRYSWEAWHYGYTLNARSTPAAHRGAGRPGDGRSAVPGFVPTAHAPAIARAASRWNVSAALLAAQIQVESGFNPFAISPAGARGIAQFMPATARAYGLRDPFDPAASISAQARLMRDLLRQFGAVALALAAYNAGPGAVERCGCVPPIAETQAYVARVLGLMGGAGDPVLVPDELEVRLVS